MGVPEGHFGEDVGGKGVADGGEAEEDGWFDVGYGLGEGFELLAFVVGAGEVAFVVCEFVASVVGYETLCVD